MPAEDGPFSFPHYSHPLGISSTACSVLGMMMGMRCLHDLRVETGPVSLLWVNLRRRKAAEYRPGGEDLAETAGSSETYYGSSSGGSSPHQSGPWRSNHGVIHSLRSGAPWLVGHRSELLAGSWAAAPWDLQLPWEENSSLKLGGRALRALGAAQPVLGLMSLSSLLFSFLQSLFPPRFALSFFSFPLLLSRFLCLLFLTRMAQKAFLWFLPSPEFSGPPPISLNLRLLVFPLPPRASHGSGIFYAQTVAIESLGPRALDSFLSGNLCPISLQEPLAGVAPWPHPQLPLKLSAREEDHILHAGEAWGQSSGWKV